MQPNSFFYNGAENADDPASVYVAVLNNIGALTRLERIIAAEIAKLSPGSADRREFIIVLHRALNHKRSLARVGDYCRRQLIRELAPSASTITDSIRPVSSGEIQRELEKSDTDERALIQPQWKMIELELLALVGFRELPPRYRKHVHNLG